MTKRGEGVFVVVGMYLVATFGYGLYFLLGDPQATMKSEAGVILAAIGGAMVLGVAALTVWRNVAETLSPIACFLARSALVVATLPVWWLVAGGM